MPLLAKRRRTDQVADTLGRVILAAHLPVLKVLRVHHDVLGDANRCALSTSRHKMATEIYRTYNAETLYGNVASTRQITTGGHTMDVYCLNPMALLRHASEVVPKFGTFLAGCLAGRPARIAIYVDEVRPGNNLRPDMGRAYQAVYFTVLELPDWYRSKCALGWMVLCFLPCRQLKDLGVTVSSFMIEVLKLFWSPTPGQWNFETVGMHLCTVTGPVHVRAVFACFLGDNKGLWEIASGRGAASYKPCIWCKNVVGRTRADQIPGDYLVHFQDGRPDKFDRHTARSYAALADTLRATIANGCSNADRTKMEKILGITYDPTGLLYSEMRPTANLPISAYADWQHCVCSSGGVGQYECNGLIFALKARRVTTAMLDDFAATVKTPKRWPRLSKKFFQERFRDKACMHLKAFASETLTAITVLGLFLDAVVKPTGNLVEFTRSFDKLRELVDLLKTNDKVVERIAYLKRVVIEHHEQYMAAYGPRCAKPKVHYTLHVADSVECWQRMLSCFAPERKHRWGKMMASFLFNKVGMTLLARSLNHFMQSLAGEDAFNHTFLEPVGKAMHEDDAATVLPVLGFGGDGVSVFSSRGLVTRADHFHAGDAIFWRLAGASGVCVANFFLCVVIQGSNDKLYWVFGDNLEFVCGAVYSTTRTTPMLIPAHALSCAVAYQRYGESMRVAMPYAL